METMDIMQVTASDGGKHAVAAERADGPIGTCDLFAHRPLRLFGVAHIDCLLRRQWPETIDDCGGSVFPYWRGPWPQRLVWRMVTHPAEIALTFL